MWRNGAVGPKTLCNACGVKYQRRMHKQKVAADAAAAAEAAAAAAGGGEDSESGSRLNRTCSGALRSAHEISGPPVLTRRSCNKAEGAAPAAAAEPAHAGQASAATSDGGSGEGSMAARRPASADVKARKARRLADAPARRSQSPQTISAQTSCAANGTAAAAAAAPMYGTADGSAGPASYASRGSTPAAAAPAAAAPATTVAASTAGALPGSSGATRLDGLQMQMAGRGGMPITIPQVTVLLQPVTRAQSLWTGSTDRTPSVALCAYDSGGSFLAAAPNIPDAAVAWSFPTSTSAAWNSGHSWALLFTQQAQHDAFRALLVEWQAATKARQSLSADAKTSSDDSGASAETETSRDSQARQYSRQSRPASAGRKRTVNCIRAVSDAVPIGGQRATADVALAAAASPKRPCSLSRSASRTAGLANWPQPSPLAPSPQQGPASAPPPPPSAASAAGGGHRRFGSNSFSDSHALAPESAPALGCVAEDRECLSPVEMEMVATLGSQSERLTHLSAGDSAAGGIPPSRSDASIAGMRISRSSSGLRAATHGFSAPAAGPLLMPMSPPGRGCTSYLPPVGPHSGADGPALMSLGSVDGWKGPQGHTSNRSSADWSPTSFGAYNSNMGDGGSGASCSIGMPMQQAGGQPYGSIGGESDMSAATGYTQLSRRFGSMHVASSDSLSDMAFSRGSAVTHFTGSAHGLNHSGMHPNPHATAAAIGGQPVAGFACSQHSADTEARVRAGQMFSGTSFASMAPAAATQEPAMMRMPSGGGKAAAPRHRHTGSCSLLDELDLGPELDPLDPRFLAQVMAPGEAAVRGGSAAHALLHGEEPLHIGPVSTEPMSNGFGLPSNDGHVDMHGGNSFHMEGSQPPNLLQPAKSSPEDWLLPDVAMPMVSSADFFAEPSFCMPQPDPPQQQLPQAEQQHYQQQHYQQQQAPDQQADGVSTALTMPQQQAPSPQHEQQAQQLQQDAVPYAAADDPIADLLGCDWLLDPEAVAADARALGTAPPLVRMQVPESQTADWEGTVQRAAAALQEESYAPWMPPRMASGSDLGAGPVLQGSKASHLMRPPPAKVAV